MIICFPKKLMRKKLESVARMKTISTALRVNDEEGQKEKTTSMKRIN